jgi:hypothetical protein
MLLKFRKFRNKLRFDCLRKQFLSTRCDRANSICQNDDNECLRKPMRIFHHYITFTYKIAVPVRIFSPQTMSLPQNGRHSIRYELKLINVEGINRLMALSSNDFNIRYIGTTTVEIFLQKQPLNLQGTLPPNYLRFF